MILIGISGKKQSGKSTVVDYLQSLFKKNAIVINFADELKRIVSLIFDDAPYPKYEVEKQKARVLACGKTVREVLQIFGTEGARSIDENCWIRAYLKQIRKEYHSVILTSDVRFPNEADTIKSNGGILIRLSRNPFPDNHLSETALDGYTEWDCVIPPEATINETTKIVNQLLIKKGVLNESTSNRISNETIGNKI